MSLNTATTTTNSSSDAPSVLIADDVFPPFPPVLFLRPFHYGMPAPPLMQLYQQYKLEPMSTAVEGHQIQDQQQTFDTATYLHPKERNERGTMETIPPGVHSHHQHDECCHPETPRRSHRTRQPCPQLWIYIRPRWRHCHRRTVRATQDSSLFGLIQSIRRCIHNNPIGH